MNRIFLLVLALLTAGCLQAQVVMTLQVPPVGLTIKPQLWDLSIVNGDGEPINVQLQVTMSDAATNQPVLTGTSPLFPLQTGASMITANTVAPVTYTAGAGYAIDPGPNGLLPVGVFNLCYTLTKWTNDISEQLAEECITVEVEPLGPPQLIQPEDSARLYFKRPFFTWLPPAPINAYSSLQYDLVLVEVQAMQTASDAIQQNIPLFNQPNISFTSLQYPLSLPELDTGKVYAWRVTAKNNSVTVANSEVWSFRVEEYTEDTIRRKSSGNYMDLKPAPDASYTICNDILRFRYRHEPGNNTVALHVTDITRSDRKQVQLDSSTYHVQYGVNYMELDVAGVSGFTDRHMYLLELINDRGERWYLKFEYRKPD